MDRFSPKLELDFDASWADEQFSNLLTHKNTIASHLRF